MFIEVLHSIAPAFAQNNDRSSECRKINTTAAFQEGLSIKKDDQSLENQHYKTPGIRHTAYPVG